MIKKLVLSLPLTTLITQIVGCYSYQEITNDELIHTEFYEDLQVKTKNQRIYQFDKGDYVVKKDLIIGHGNIVNNSVRKRDFNEFKGSIYFGDIETFYFDRLNSTITIVAIVIVVGLLALIISSIKVSPLKGLGDNHGNDLP